MPPLRLGYKKTDFHFGVSSPSLKPLPLEEASCPASGRPMKRPLMSVANSHQRAETSQQPREWVWEQIFQPQQSLKMSIVLANMVVAASSGSSVRTERGQKCWGTG